MTEPESNDTKNDGPDGVLAYAMAMENPDRNDPNWPLPSFDARDWAKAFVEIATKNGHAGLDEGWMLTWFANALMRGFDEYARRMGKRIAALKNCVDVQCTPGNFDANDYMHGMANGLILALHTIRDDDGEPPYIGAKDHPE